jgi:hypothetical protein
MATNSTVFENEIILTFETVFGTTPVDGFKFPVVSFTPSVTKTQTVAPEINGEVTDGKPISGFRAVEMDLVVRVRANATGYLLKAMFGLPATTGVGPYTHTFTPSTLEGLSVSIEHGLTTLGDYYLASGGKVSSLALTVGGDGDLQITFKVMAIDYQWAATSAFTGVVTDLTGETTLLNNFDGSITNGANPTIDQYTVNINRTLEMFQELDGTEVASLAIEGKYQADGTVQALYENDTLLALARANTSDAFTGKLVNGTNELNFIFPTAVWDETALAADAATTKQMVTPKFTQFDTFSVELINDTATYV